MKGHTLVLAGELDRVSAPVLETEIERLCAAGVNSLTLDVRALSEIDPAGVAVIVHRSGWCARHGCRMSLLADAGPARRAFAEASASGRVELVRVPENADEIGERAEREPVRAGNERALLVRPNAFAPPGKVALAAATGHGGTGEARSASLLRVSGRWARTRRSRRARSRR
jgi:anti-anti-sigma factor